MKSLLVYILQIKILLSVLNLSAQNSPAGLGNYYELNLWISAETVTGIDDGEPLSINWTDQSGKNHHASQSTTAYQPTFHESVVNGLPVVRFDGVNDFLDNSHNYEARSVFIVFQMKNALQNTSHLAQLWGSYQDGVHIAPEARSNADHMGFSFDGLPSSGNRARYGLNGNNYSGYANDSNVQKWEYNRFEIVAVEFEANRTLTRQVLGSLYPNFNVGQHQFGGDIAEIIVFEDQLGPTQKILIENYLSSKYNLPINNDLYVYDVSHPHDLAGIGRQTSGNKQIEALSAGILGLKESDALAVGDYILTAHDNADINTWSASGTPIGFDTERLSRTWRLGLTNNPGETIVVLDTTALPAKSSSSKVWAVLTSPNGNFSSNAEIYILEKNAGRYESKPIQFNDGDYIAIAAVKPELDFTKSNFIAFENEDSMVVSIRLNIPLSSDVGFTFQTSDSTAISPDDYESINASYTIPAGDTILHIAINLVNDTIVEPDEYFNLKLIPDDLNIFDEKTALATILDDDNPRKISFQHASSSGSESVNTVNVNVVLNSVDSVNSTTVNYRVKGGTATPGVDFILNDGTLNFDPLSSSESFTITVIEDTIFNSDRTIIIELYDPTNANLSDIEPIEFTYTIIDNNPKPQLGFPITHMAKLEDNITVKIPVKLSAPSGLDVYYEYSLIGGTATPGSDFIFNNGIASILSGDIHDTILLQIIDDQIIEIDETVIISINVLTGAETGADSIFTFTIIDNDIFGFTGPGGVGDSVLNTLWLDAGKITGINSGNSINTHWPDRSGNNRHASQSNAAYQPAYIENEINGLPVVRFDGNNDFFDNTYDYDVASGIIVMKVNSSLQSTSQLGQVFGNYDEGHFAFDPRSMNLRGVSFDGGTSEKGRYRLNGGNYTPYQDDTNAEQWEYNEYFIITGDFENIINFSRMVIGSLYPRFNVGQHEFGGEIAEIILYQNHLNEAQKVIIENYLSSKYDIAIEQDYYSFDDTHNHDVIGVGRADENNLHIRSKSSDILKIKNPQLLVNGSYIFTGHDNQNISVWQTAGAPNATTKILERSWRFDVSDTTAQLSISIDTTNLPALPPGFAAWTLLLNQDGDFTNESMYLLPELDINGHYTVNNILINSGDVVSIAAVKNISAQNGTFNTPSSWISGVPGVSDTVIVAANHTIVLTEDVETAHTHLSRFGKIELHSYTFTISEGSMDIYGNMEMGNGTINYSALGNQKIADLNYHHLKIEGSGIKTLSGNTAVYGDLILNSATLDADINNNYLLQVSGNWINNGGTFNARNAEVDFNGSALQSITTNGDAFYTLSVSGAGPYELQDDVTVSNELILQSGVVKTLSNKMIISNTAESALSTYSNSSFVNGNLERAIGTGINNYIFPVGNGENATDYYPAEIESNELENVNLISVYFTDLERHDDADLDITDLLIDYQSVSQNGMWVINPDQQPTDGTYNVKLFIENKTGLSDNEFAIIKRPTGAPNGSSWSAPGSINENYGDGRLLSSGYALRMNLESFSEFAIGSGSESSNPLPVELLYFEAYKKGEKALLKWATSTEINSESFEIERSSNAQDFTTIGQIKAMGNSLEEVLYTFIDKSPLNGSNYYRLKQIDIDGQFEIFPVKQLYFDEKIVETVTNIYPNPSGGEFINIDFDRLDIENDESGLVIYDSQGKQVFEFRNFTSESNRIEFNNKLSPGIYIIDLQIGHTNRKVKLNIK